VSDLEDYLFELFTQKLEIFLNFQKLDFSDEEIMHIVALALNSAFSGSSKLHPHTTEN
jgi:hypothetical protein